MAVTYTSTEKADVDKVVEAASTLTLRTMFTSGGVGPGTLDEAQANLKSANDAVGAFTAQHKMADPQKAYEAQLNRVNGLTQQQASMRAAGNAVGAAAMSSTIASHLRLSTGSGRSSTSTTRSSRPVRPPSQASPRPGAACQRQVAARRSRPDEDRLCLRRAPGRQHRDPDAHRHRRGRRRLPPGAPPRGHARGDRPGRHERSSAEAAAAADTAVYTPSHRANGSSGAPGTRTPERTLRPRTAARSPACPRAKH